MTSKRLHSLVFVAFVGIVLASVVPIALSVSELGKLRWRIGEIESSADIADQIHEVVTRMGMGVAEFTAIALEVDPAEQVKLRSTTDSNIAGFTSSVTKLRDSLKTWLTAAEAERLLAAADDIAHSWSEVRRGGSELSTAERTFHFLQITDQMIEARSILSRVEAQAMSAAKRQTEAAFSDLGWTSFLLLSALAVGFLVSSSGSFGIFRALQRARESNRKLAEANKALTETDNALKYRSAQLVEAQRLGKLGDWSYRLGDAEVWWSPETFELLGYDQKTFKTTRSAVLAIHPQEEVRKLLDAQSDVFRTGEVRTVDIKAIRGDGTFGDFAIATKAMHDESGRVVGFVGTVQDISERKNAQEQLEKLAYYDPLTGLANRALFVRQMQEIVARCSRVGEGGMMLLLDLDRFKEVNDSLGHAAGDELLVKVARQISTKLGAGNFVARLGGDEFAVVVPDCVNPESMERIAVDVIDAASGSFQLERGEVSIGTSVGIVQIPRDGSTTSELLRNADLALYEAKEKGRGRFEFFKCDLDIAVQHKTALARDLRKALAEDTGLAVHYQPQIGFKSGHVVGFEALIRWNHPTRGMVPPNEFIPIAESSSLICDVGQWVVAESTRQAKLWIDSGEPPRKISVNISPAQIWYTDVERDVALALERSGLPSRLLTVELTETLLANHNEARVRSVLKGLKRLGTTLALDDFGTGYSSLGYLNQLPFDELKIDRVFVHRAASAPRRMELLKGIIALGRGLGMAVVGEGAETVSEVEMLKSQGCDVVQGYACARPAPSATALAYARACERDGYAAMIKSAGDAALKVAS